MKREIESLLLFVVYKKEPVMRVNVYKDIYIRKGIEDNSNTQVLIHQWCV